MRSDFSATTVFARLRASVRSGQPFSPTPVATRSGPAARIRSAELGIYATVEEFASLVGLDERTVKEMWVSGKLTHIRVSADGPWIHVAKGLRDLERLEHGPEAQSA